MKDVTLDKNLKREVQEKCEMRLAHTASECGTCLGSRSLSRGRVERPAKARPNPTRRTGSLRWRIAQRGEP